MATFLDFPAWNFARIVRGTKSLGALVAEENRDTIYGYEAVLNGDGWTLTTQWYYSEAEAIKEILALVGSYHNTHSTASGTLQFIGATGVGTRTRTDDVAETLYFLGSASGTKTTINTGLVQTVQGITGITATGSGRLLVLAIAGSGLNVTSVTDNKGNSWGKIDGTSNVQLWASIGSIAGVTTVSVNYGAAPSAFSYIFREYNTSYQTLDAHAIDTLGSIVISGGVANSTGSGTLSASGELVIGYGVLSDTAVANNGFAHYIENTGSTRAMMEDKNSTSTASVSTSIMMPGGGNVYLGVAVFRAGVILQPDPGGGGEGGGV